MPCPFCRLDDRKLLWQSDLVVAIADGYPVSPGHTLVIPRRHVATWFDASPWEQQEIWRAIGELKARFDAEYQPAGYNIGINVGAAAGQTVMHLHVHLIPRYDGDMTDPRGGVRGVIPERQKYGDSEPPSPTTGLGPFAALPAFVSGGDSQLVDVLVGALALSDQADWLAAFVQHSGVELVHDHLVDALERGVRVRLLTGDYHNITHAHGLQRLWTLQDAHPSLEVRFFLVHETGGSFHPKAYLFRAGDDAVAWVGSSNLSRLALTDGLEWNLRGGDDARVLQRQFEELWADPRAKPLTPELIAAYAERAPVPQLPEPASPKPIPNEIQAEALKALRRTREDGEQRGLVVLATGLGKTYLSAFDCDHIRAGRALFVAHREEILTQARDSWAKVFPGRSVGLMVGGERCPDADLVFASVQTLSRSQTLRLFAPDHFDYIVIDEFHHAAATTYRRILGHFRPAFLLGLTATPDRMDGASLRDLCDDNEVFRAGLVEGISRGLLVPFHYFGVKDGVDYETIPWRSGRFDAERLDAKVATEARAAQALSEYRSHAPDGVRRTLAFCCSVRHADYMAGYFRAQGIQARAVHSQGSSAPRAATLNAFRRGDVEVICAVDIFNEGVDLPDVNTILMLRPTQSIVIFLQQLGRGLRLSKRIDKPHLTVVDFIGNHRSFLIKPQALLTLTGRTEVPPGAAPGVLRRADLLLPEGCKVEIATEALDMLEQVARLSRKDTLLYEYMALRDTHGRRPTAGEVFAAGVHLKPLKDHYETWFDFVAQQSDLESAEQALLDRYRPWFSDLLRTQMSRSYKMVALRVLLDAGRLHEGMFVRELSEQCREFLARDLLLRQELAEHEDAGGDLDEFVARWRNMPLKIFHDAKGFSRRWFRLEAQRFEALLGVEDDDRALFDAMTEELVDLRLREVRARLRTSDAFLTIGAPIPLVVTHRRGQAVLRFDRSKRPDVPTGDVEVRLDGTPFWFRFDDQAVELAYERLGGVNVLPRLMHGWFGPHAGQPGTQHRVLLRLVSGRWNLQPDRVAAVDEDGTLIPFPELSYYEELAVACGPKNAQFIDGDARTPLRIRTERGVDPGRHIVVRADGDSMDGGPHPIRHGDLVLCELQAVSRPEEVEGKACLLAGWEGPDQSFAMIKVPVCGPQGEWLLRSWNSDHPDLPIEPGIELHVRALVCEVVEEARGPMLWGLFTRDDAVAALGQEHNASWNVGVRDWVAPDGSPHTAIFVTLRKRADAKAEHRYAERFVSPSEFQWESQDRATPESVWGRRIIHHAAEGRTLHLFVRYAAKLRHSRGEKFLYCGDVTHIRHESSKPIRVWFRLSNPLPDKVHRLWAD